MKAKIRWYSFLLVGLVLLLASSVVACASAPERSAVESYLADIYTILLETTGIAMEEINLLENEGQYSESQIIAKLATYEKEYNDLLLRLIALECPHECSELQEYTIDAITYYKLSVTENWAAFATGDYEHFDKSLSYIGKATKAHSLVNEEWDRLKGWLHD